MPSGIRPHPRAPQRCLSHILEVQSARRRFPLDLRHLGHRLLCRPLGHGEMAPVAQRFRRPVPHPRALAFASVVSAPGKHSCPRRRPPFPRQATKELIIKEMSCPAKLIELLRVPRLIPGARRPGPLISVPLHALFRFMWISPLLALAARAFPPRRGCAGLLPGGLSLCWSLLRSAKAPAAAPAAWRSRKPRLASSPDSATCSPATRKFSALFELTRG